MKKRKLRVGVIFGGRSGEHEVSLMSARSVINALDPERYEVMQIGVTHEGEWLVGEDVLGSLEKNETAHLMPVIFFARPGLAGSA
jgi:D-alanine-D-alanine ligase